jgi:hypothetical protein
MALTALATFMEDRMWRMKARKKPRQARTMTKATVTDSRGTKPSSPSRLFHT